MTRFRPSERQWVLLLAFGAFALWLTALGGRSLWADEFATNRIMERPDFSAMLAYTPLSERRPPLYYIVLWWWQSLAGSSEFAFRYLSLGFATLAIPMFWTLARSAARIAAAPARFPSVVAPLLLACSPMIALFGIMIRNFPMMLAASLLVNWLFARWLARVEPGSARKEATTWLASATLLIWIDYHAWAVIGAQALWVIAHGDLRKLFLRQTVAAIGILFVAFIPLIPPLLEQVERAKQDADLARDATGFVLRVAYPLFVFPFGETILPWHPAIILAAPAVAWLIVRSFVSSQTRHLAVLGALLFAAPLVFNVIVLTVIATDLTFLAVASRTLSALPPFLLLVAAGAETIDRRLRHVALGTLLFANVAALYNLWTGIEYHNPIYAVPLRSLHADLSRRALPGDLIVSDLDIVYQYYYDREPIPDTKLLLTEDENLPAIERAISSGTPRVWLFAFGRDRSLAGDRAPRVRAWLDANGYVGSTPECYAPTDPTYRLLKERLIPREAYVCKLVVVHYEKVRQ